MQVDVVKARALTLVKADAVQERESSDDEADVALVNEKIDDTSKSICVTIFSIRFAIDALFDINCYYRAVQMQLSSGRSRLM
jgi:hypothetical protein